VRSISPKTAAALKSTTQAAYDAVGGVMQASDLTGIGSPQLTKYASRDEKWADRFIRIDIAVDLDRRSPHPFILTTMAREIGFRIVPDASRADGMSLCPMGILRLDGILADVVRETATAIADGHVCAAEKHLIRKKIAAAKIALAQLDALLIGGAE
jgi:hypothetical protein